MKKIMPFKNGILNLRRGFGLLALAFSASLSSCEQGCGFGNEPEPGCETHVTVVAAGCASGAFESRWLQLDNGELLQPFENKTNITTIEDGDEFMIGYETMKRDKRYDHQLACLALPPKGTPVRLLCMTPLAEPAEGCNTIVTARAVECGMGAWGNIWLQLEDGRYLQPWNNDTGTAQLAEGAKYKIGYSQMVKDNRYNDGVICAAMPSDPKAWTPEVVSVNCIEQVSGN